jgi:hypothetical protein
MNQRKKKEVCYYLRRRTQTTPTLMCFTKEKNDRKSVSKLLRRFQTLATVASVLCQKALARELQTGFTFVSLYWSTDNLSVMQSPFLGASMPPSPPSAQKKSEQKDPENSPSVDTKTLPAAAPGTNNQYQVRTIFPAIKPSPRPCCSLLLAATVTCFRYRWKRPWRP